jgi:AcrR family transcriptional regulator
MQMTVTSSTRKLSTAEERRASVLDAAMPIFAASGYAASTLEIAKAAGISQAYLFRLFPTKAELFAAVTDAASERMQATFRDAAAHARAEGTDPLDEMGKAYDELLDRDRDVLLVQLHSRVVAGAEPVIREAVQRCFRKVYELAARESGAGDEELRVWFAHGMLCDVMAAIDADRVDEPWARALTGGPATD